MAIDIDSVSKEFFTQFRNGNAWSENPSETTDILQCNVGELVRYEQTIQITVIVNENKVIPLSYSDLGGGTSQLEQLGVDFKIEGLRTGQSVTIEQGTQSGTATITNITGSFNSKLQFDNTNIDFISDGGPHTDIVISVITQPNYLRYNYAINPEGFTENNYASAIDGSTQAYTLGGIAAVGSLTEMTRVGTNESWDLTTSIQVRHVQTVNTHTHEFEIVHIFRTHWYIEEEDFNITDLINPSDMFGVATRKYANGWFFGYNSTAIVATYEDTFGSVGSGNVGYYNEALNGFENIYTLDSLTITNTSATGVLEVSETNSVTAVVTASDTVFTATQRVIVNYSKLPFSSEYSGSTDSSDTVFVRDSLLQNAGDVAVSSTIISDLEVTQDSTSQITIEFDIAFSAAQQDLLNTINDYLLWITVGDQSLNADDERPVNLVLEKTNYSKNTDDTSLIDTYSLTITDTFNSFAAGKFSTDINGWDGDWYGVALRFNLNQFANEDPNLIRFASWQVIASDGTDEFLINAKGIPLGPLLTSTDGTYIYQIIDQNIIDEFNIPTTDDLNIIDFQMLANDGFDFQPAAVQLSFRIPWQSWIENLDVPTSFFDVSEPNNGRNRKTSNYSGVSSFEIFVQLQLDVQKLSDGTTTTYNLRSDQCDIDDFDVDVSGNGWTKDPNYFDLDNFAVNNLFIDEEVRIEYGFDHTLGTLSDQDLWGFIWIEPTNSTGQPWVLATWKDFTNPSNPLVPTDTLATGNTQFVEIVSTNNNVKLICKTNRDNLVEGTEYKVRARLGKQT